MKRYNALTVLLCPTWDTTSEHLDAWRDLSPTITFLRPTGSHDSDFIGIDNYQAAYDITSRLVRDGHTHIAFIGGIQSSRLRRQRLQGWKDAHEDAALRWDETHILYCSSRMSAGIKAARELFKRDQNVTALVCYQDIVAFGAMNALHFLGKRVGEEIAVTGFDGFSDAEGWLPFLRLKKPNDPPNVTLLHAHIRGRNSSLYGGFE